MRIIITGARGWFARDLATELAKSHKVEMIVGVSRTGGPAAEFDQILTNDAYYNSFSHATDDIIIHCAFSRKSDQEKLEESLHWTNSVFEKACRSNIAGIVNISSQAVYGGGGLLNTEKSDTHPTYPYAHAKLEAEGLLLEAAKANKYRGAHTSLRVASLMGVSSGVCPSCVLQKFIDNALMDLPIHIVGGKQRFSFLSIHDASAAIVSLVETSCSSWEPIYNIGPSSQVSIVDVAQTVCACAKSHTNIEVPIDIEDRAIELNAGMNCDLARQKLKWSPAWPFKDIVEEMLLLRKSELDKAR